MVGTNSRTQKRTRAKWTKSPKPIHLGVKSRQQEYLDGISASEGSVEITISPSSILEHHRIADAILASPICLRQEGTENEEFTEDEEFTAASSVGNARVLVQRNLRESLKRMLVQFRRMKCRCSYEQFRR